MVDLKAISEAHELALGHSKGILWPLGAYTAARCALWSNLSPTERDDLTRWVMMEKKRLQFWPNELPELRKMQEKFGRD